MLNLNHLLNHLDFTCAALLHDLGKASSGRFDNHAHASASILRSELVGHQSPPHQLAFLLQLIERHHHPLPRKDGTVKQTDSELAALKLADRLAAARRVTGGNSKSFLIDGVTHKHLFVVEAYLRHDLKKLFSRVPAVGYLELRQFIIENPWLELIPADTTDARCESLRDHLLCCDNFFQRLLLSGQQPPEAIQISLQDPAFRVPLYLGTEKYLDLRVDILSILAENGSLWLLLDQIWREMVDKELTKGRRRKTCELALKELREIGLLEVSYGKYHLRGEFAAALKMKIQKVVTRQQGTTMRMSAAERVRIWNAHVEGFDADWIAAEAGRTREEVEAVLAI